MTYNTGMHATGLSVPSEIRTICETLKNAGYESYIVGGCVRDLYINRAPKDWDITTNAKPEAIQALFEETFYENDYGTVGVVTQSESPALKIVEITPYRTESTYSNARHPDAVEFSDSLADDLKRRDFTINAIAYDPLTDSVVDLHNGMDDLHNKRIVTVGDPYNRFQEDALRMLRAIRIAVELDFVIDAETMAAIAKHSELLSKISQERIRDELTRVLMSPRPMQGIFMAQKLGVLKYIIPELEEAIGIDQNQAHSFDVFEHLVRSMQHAADKNWPFEIRIAALLHDIGKPATRVWSSDKKDWTFYNHEVVGARMARKILNNLRFPKATIETVTTLIRWHMFFSDPDSVTLSAVRRIISNVGRENISSLIDLRICDRIGTGRPKEQPFRLRKYMSMIDEALRDPITVGMLAIDGKGLMEIIGEGPGPRLGWMLHALLEEVLNDPALNTKEYMEKRALELKELPEETLRTLGEQGKDKKEMEDAAEVLKLREKHHVS
ncbi:MAG: polynucleotide adenylyltransferase [Candidatus Kaiserbacteria bacterium]|nr:polynucleotide adenylyltransferase [Candidatus Kaiserbacteria bacterium]